MREIAGPGLAAGWAGGVVVMLAAMAHASFAGLGPVWPAEQIASALLPRQAAEGTLGALLGVAVHFLLSGLWGVLFNAAVPRGVPYARAALYGVGFAVVLFLLTRWLVLPRLAPALFHGVSGWVLLVYHLVYGLILPMAIPMRREATAADDRIESKEGER